LGLRVLKVLLGTSFEVWYRPSDPPPRDEISDSGEDFRLWDREIEAQRTFDGARIVGPPAQSCYSC
jgi:hypothetical protein